MSARKLFWILASSLGIVIIGILATTYVFTGVIQNKASELATSRATIEQLNNQQVGLAKSKDDVAKYSDLEKIARAIVPQDKDQAQAVLELNNIAAADDISLASITFPTSSLGTNGTSQNLSQLTPVAGIPGVYNLQITVTNDTNTAVTFTQLDNFLRDLENNRRTAQVASINIQPNQDNPKLLTFSLVINTYIKP